MFERINRARTSTLVIIAVAVGVSLGVAIIWAALAYIHTYH